MFCCDHCFADHQILAMVNQENKVGTCDVCGCASEHLCDLSKCMDVKETIMSLVDEYAPFSALKDRILRRRVVAARRNGLLPELLLNDTNVFKLDGHKLRKLLVGIGFSAKSLRRHYFPRWMMFDSMRRRMMSVLVNDNWDSVVAMMREQYRFIFFPRINVRNFCEAVNRCSITIRPADLYYRARLTEDGNKFSPKEMMPPPAEICRAGRLNPSGIRVLYLADSRETAIKEVRPKICERACVARFRVKSPIRVLDLCQIKSLGPFDSSKSPSFYLMNKRTLEKVADEFGSIVNGNNNDRDYAATQYVCEIIKKGFEGLGLSWDGVKYRSTLNPSGYNVAIFNPDMCEMVPRSQKVYQIGDACYTLKDE